MAESSRDWLLLPVAMLSTCGGEGQVRTSWVCSPPVLSAHAIVFCEGGTGQEPGGGGFPVPVSSWGARPHLRTCEHVFRGSVLTAPTQGKQDPSCLADQPEQLCLWQGLTEQEGHLGTTGDWETDLRSWVHLVTASSYLRVSPQVWRLDTSVLFIQLHEAVWGRELCVAQKNKNKKWRPVRKLRS